MPNLAWIGLGNMGMAMALNLAEAVKPDTLKVFNRTLSRSQELADQSSAIIEVTETYEELISNTDIIFICLANDAALVSTLDGLLNAGSLESKVICEMSTVHPDTTRKEAARCEKAGATLIAAPVFGAPAAASSAQLVIAKAGDPQAFTVVEPYFKHLSRASFSLGEDPGLASLMKITGNSFILSMIETIAEGLTFSEVSGLGVDNCMKFLSTMFGGTPWEAYAKRMTSGDYMPAPGKRPGFASEIALKDCTHAINIAQNSAQPYQMSILKHVQQNLTTVCEDERFEGRADVSSVYGIERARAGIQLENEAVRSRK